MMRTTVNLPDDVYEMARSIAGAKRISLGDALAELARNSLRRAPGSSRKAPFPASPCDRTRRRSAWRQRCGRKTTREAILAGHQCSDRAGVAQPPAPSRRAGLVLTQGYGRVPDLPPDRIRVCADFIELGVHFRGGRAQRRDSSIGKRDEVAGAWLLARRSCVGRGRAGLGADRTPAGDGCLPVGARIGARRGVCDARPRSRGARPTSRPRRRADCIAPRRLQPWTGAEAVPRHKTSNFGIQDYPPFRKCAASAAARRNSTSG
jgi:hypothetical protein